MRVGCGLSGGLPWCIACHTPSYWKMALASCGPVPIPVTWNEGTVSEAGEHGSGAAPTRLDTSNIEKIFKLRTGSP